MSHLTHKHPQPLPPFTPLASQKVEGRNSRAWPKLLTLPCEVASQTCADEVAAADFLRGKQSERERGKENSVGNHQWPPDKSEQQQFLVSLCSSFQIRQQSWEPFAVWAHSKKFLSLFGLQIRAFGDEGRSSGGGKGLGFLTAWLYKSQKVKPSVKLTVRKKINSEGI